MMTMGLGLEDDEDGESDVTSVFSFDFSKLDDYDASGSRMPNPWKGYDAFGSRMFNPWKTEGKVLLGMRETLINTHWLHLIVYPYCECVDKIRNFLLVDNQNMFWFRLVSETVNDFDETIFLVEKQT